MSRMAARGIRLAYPALPLSHRLLLGRERSGAQAGERLADQAGDLHLRHADARADLGLGEILDEAQAQHLALARGDGGHEALERGAVLGQAEAALLVAERVAEAVTG